MSVFYDHLVNLDEIHNALLQHDLPTTQHYHLLKIADSTFHNDILNVILTEIPTDHHEYFLVEFQNKPDDLNHLVFLKQFSPDIEDKILHTSVETKAKILGELINSL
ncbi:hypothetical protein IH981_01395 [Patescibacteria group bacterium]|nr:hypothetical protein [Patescibacteria group bacterium]